MIALPPIGFSCLKDFERQGAAAWKGIHLDKTIPKTASTAAQVIGTATHACALEGRKALDKICCVLPGGEWESDDRRLARELALGLDGFHRLAEPINRRTKDGKAAWMLELEAAGSKPIILNSEVERLAPLTAAYVAAAGRMILSAGDFEMVLRMGAAVRECPEAMGLIETAAVETELAAEMEVETTTGPVTIAVRGRLDVAGRGYVADLKSAEDLTPSVFDRSIINYDYHRQLAYYSALRVLSGDDTPHEPDDTAFIIGVEKPATPHHPVRVEVISIPDALLEIGMRANMISLANLVGCYQSDSWGAAVRGVRLLRMPGWIA